MGKETEITSYSNLKDSPVKECRRSCSPLHSPQDIDQEAEYRCWCTTEDVRIIELSKSIPNLQEYGLVQGILFRRNLDNTIEKLQLELYTWLPENKIRPLFNKSWESWMADDQEDPEESKQNYSAYFESLKSLEGLELFAAAGGYYTHFSYPKTDLKQIIGFQFYERTLKELQFCNETYEQFRVEYRKALAGGKSPDLKLAKQIKNKLQELRELIKKKEDLISTYLRLNEVVLKEIGVNPYVRTTN